MVVRATNISVYSEPLGKMGQLNSVPANEPTRLGYQSPPSQRGTLDIVWSCASALLLCLWTMLHLNLPAPHDGWIATTIRKMRWLLLGLLAPELPMLIASGQLASAMRSVSSMRASGYGKESWTLCHAFFADSGGYVFQPRDSKSFPITAKQLHYLVAKQHIDMPHDSREDIEDKSKGDKVVKLLALLQAGWLVIQIIARGIEQLFITPLETSTLALICSSLTTLGFWWHKPLDVRASIILHSNRSTAEILLEAGSAAHMPFLDTPLDFVEGHIYMSGKWSQTLLRWICRLRIQTRPLNRIPNDRDPEENLKIHCILAIGTAAFATLHFIGWNFSFASAWERILWRSCCIGITCLLGPYGFIEMWLCYRDDYARPSLESGGAYKMRWPRCLLFFIPATLYLLARLGLLVVTLASFASLPSDAYLTVQWTSFLPHV